MLNDALTSGAVRAAPTASCSSYDVVSSCQRRVPARPHLAPSCVRQMSVPQGQASSSKQALCQRHGCPATARRIARPTRSDGEPGPIRSDRVQASSRPHARRWRAVSQPPPMTPAPARSTPNPSPRHKPHLYRSQVKTIGSAFAIASCGAKSHVAQRWSSRQHSRRTGEFCRQFILSGWKIHVVTLRRHSDASCRTASEDVVAAFASACGFRRSRATLLQHGRSA